VAFLPDGRRAVSGGRDRTIRLWDVENARELDRFPGHRAEVTWVAVSPDGRRLLSSDFNGHDLRLWDIEARTQVDRINWGDVSPTRGSFSPDGRYVVWAGSDGVVRLYRLAESGGADRPAAPAPPAATGRAASPQRGVDKAQDRRNAKSDPISKRSIPPVAGETGARPK
jgi:WD40 repeat protein